MTENQEPDGKSFIGRLAAGASDRVFEIVDPNVVLDHVDVEALINRVDVNALLDRVDVNALLDRVDVDALMARADIDAIMERVDIQNLVDRAGIPEIVAESTSHLGGSALDLFRRPLVGLDEILFRVLNRLIGRDPTEFPHGPEELVDWVNEQKEETEALKTGRYAGPLTRLLAVVLDTVIVTTGFTLILAGISFMVGLIAPDADLPANSGIWAGVIFVVWAFSYLWISLAVFGKTIGKMVLGVRVVGADGALALQGRQAFVRAFTYPLSFLILGIGLLGVVFGRERRAWHDHFASSAVVYDWGSRTATMPTPLARFLERRAEEEE